VTSHYCARSGCLQGNGQRSALVKRVIPFPFGLPRVDRQEISFGFRRSSAAAMIGDAHEASSEGEETLLVGRLRARISGLRCPSGCSQFGGSFGVGDLVAAPIIERGVPAGVALGNQFQVMVPVTCNTCGFVAHYSINGLVTLDG
jgi:hypothetical protein